MQALQTQATDSAAYDAQIAFPLAGEGQSLGIRVSEQGLVAIDFLQSNQKITPQTPLAREVVRQLKAYFRDPHFQFDLPLVLQGTPFQQRVWRAMRRIPAGGSETYGGMARGLKSGARAVGQACRRNPIPIVVPCHRVLSLHDVGGYSGALSGEKLDTKLALLQHEGLSPESLPLRK